MVDRLADLRRTIAGVRVNNLFDPGGKSKKTKRIRSSTPRGWANAVFFANWTLKQFGK